MKASEAGMLREPHDGFCGMLDDFPFVDDPLDLCGHTLRIEVYGVHPITTRVVDSTITYAPPRPPAGTCVPLAVRSNGRRRG